MFILSCTSWICIRRLETFQLFSLSYFPFLAFPFFFFFFAEIYAVSFQPNLSYFTLISSCFSPLTEHFQLLSGQFLSVCSFPSKSLSLNEYIAQKVTQNWTGFWKKRKKKEFVLKMATFIPLSTSDLYTLHPITKTTHFHVFVLVIAA